MQTPSKLTEENSFIGFTKIYFAKKFSLFTCNPKVTDGLDIFVR